MSPTLKYKSGGVFTSTGGSSEPAPYVRPADWLALPTVLSSDQKFVGLYAVFNHESNFVAVKCQGNYTVDWGDGTAVENKSSNVQANHNYVYSALGSGTLSIGGYRQAIVTITPQAGQNLTKVDLYVQHSQSGLVSGSTTGWLDIRMAGSLVSILTLGGQLGTPFHRMLEQFEYVGSSAITTCVSKFGDCVRLRSVIGTAWTATSITFDSMFQNCVSLQTVPLLNTAAGMNFANMFSGCSSLQTVPLLNTAAGTNFASMFQTCVSLQTVPLVITAAGTAGAFSSMFSGCRSLRTVPLLNTAAGTDFSSMFSSCSSLPTIPLINTAAGTNFGSMFSSCSSLQTVPLINTAAGTTFSNMFNACVSLEVIPFLNTAAGTTFSSMFSGCPSLRVGALSGTSKTIAYTNCALGPAALDAIYTNLASGVSAQTITVTGNWGVATDTPSIATAKGWTVTG